MQRMVAMFGAMTNLTKEAPEQFEALVGKELGLYSRANGYRTDHGRVAVLRLEGTIQPIADAKSYYMGAVSLETLAQNLKAAIEDPNIKAVCLHVDSPGGQVVGVSEFAALIKSLSKNKPIYGYASGMAASSAYWILSACQIIAVAPQATLGSIGVLYSFFDWSEANANRGLEITSIVSSQSPKKGISPATEEGKKEYQALADEMAQTFIEDVATNRDVSAETVASKFGRGFVLNGSKAVKAGMADQVATFEDFLAQIEAKAATEGSTEPTAETETLNQTETMTTETTAQGTDTTGTEATVAQDQVSKDLATATAKLAEATAKLAKAEETGATLQAETERLTAELAKLGAQPDEEPTPKAHGLTETNSIDDGF